MADEGGEGIAWPPSYPKTGRSEEESLNCFWRPFSLIFRAW